MPRVYVSVGSNVEREKNIRGAVTALRSKFGDVVTSKVYASKAEGFVGDDFYNLAATFDTEQPLESVRETLMQIENTHGRTRHGPRHGPRTLDIDILLYGNLVRHEHPWDIPRREIRKHAFVLGPLVEIAPTLCDPETGEHYAELWRRFTRKNDLRGIALDLTGPAPQ